MVAGPARNLTSLASNAARRESWASSRPNTILVRRLDRRTVVQNRQQGEDGAIGEIGIIEDTARLAHDVTIDARALADILGALYFEENGKAACPDSHRHAHRDLVEARRSLCYAVRPPVCS
jgi:hypothetical protein